MNSIIVSKTVMHILFSLKALSQCFFFFFFVTGAALCIQLINQQNSLCMIGLQHWNECWRSHSPQRIRNTHCTWNMSVWLLDFSGVSMAVHSRTMWWKTGFAGQKCAFIYSALVKKKKKHNGSGSSCRPRADACRTNWPCGTISSAGQLQEVRASVLQVTVSLKLIIVHA